MPGNGWCQDFNGNEGTARYFEYPVILSDVAAKCKEDSSCAAFAFSPKHSQAVVYSSTGCTISCSSTSWIQNPLLIVQAGEDHPPGSWADASCFRKIVTTGTTPQEAGDPNKKGRPTGTSSTPKSKEWGCIYPGRSIGSSAVAADTKSMEDCKNLCEANSVCFGMEYWSEKEECHMITGRLAYGPDTNYEEMHDVQGVYVANYAVDEYCEHDCCINDVIQCDTGEYCAGNQCCADGTICPSAESLNISCLYNYKLEDCTGITGTGNEEGMEDYSPATKLKKWMFILAISGSGCIIASVCICYIYYRKKMYNGEYVRLQNEPPRIPSHTW